MTFLFWASVIILVYIYVFYPVILVLRAWVVNCPIKENPDRLSNISVLIAAHNEEHSIEEKLKNILSLDYPADRLEVIIASDGSTDATNDLIEQYQDRGVKLLALPRQGKAKTLNAAVAESSGDILVFSDANSLYRADAIRELAKYFADPEVGGVAGNQVYLKGSDRTLTAQGEQSYWSFDRLLKEMQSRSGNVISATGAIYAIRRTLFMEIPDGVTDDFITSTRVILQGYRLVFARDAIAYEPVSSSSGVEFGRKVRIITRGLTGVLTVAQLLNPFKYGFYAIQLFSHKVLRRMAVFPLITLFLSNLFLWQSDWFYRLTLIGQFIFYLFALLGWWMERQKIGKLKLISIPYFFCSVNLAAFMAVLNVVRGRKITVWTPQREI